MIYIRKQAIDGIKHDSVELVRAALRHKHSNPEERLEAAGSAGAPFSFANAVRAENKRELSTAFSIVLCTVVAHT